MRKPSKRPSYKRAVESAEETMKAMFRESLIRGLCVAEDACELNMAAYEQAESARKDAEMLAKVKHDLLVEAWKEIKRLSEALALSEEAVRLQQDMLIRYNMHGNLIRWFGQFVEEQKGVSA